MLAFDVPPPPIWEGITHSLPYIDENDDDASQAMEEHLQEVMNRPLHDDHFPSRIDTEDKPKTTIPLNISTHDNDYTTNKMEGKPNVKLGSNMNLTSLFKMTTSTGKKKFSDSVRNRSNYTSNTNDCSSFSEGTTDPQHSDHTCPETPPTPLSFESDGQFPGLISIKHSDVTPPSNSSSPILLRTLSRSTKENSPIRSCLAFNPITSHSPQRKSRLRRQRATFGMSIFSCFDSGEEGVVSNSKWSRNHRNIFRKQCPALGDNDDDYDDHIITYDSEEELENAAREIRAQLLQKEMLHLAAEAEQAAESGIDRFIRHPMAGVVQDDMIRGATANRCRNGKNQRKPSLQAMRRSLSEGSYLPQKRLQERQVIKQQQSASNFVSSLFTESSMPVSSGYVNPKASKNQLHNVLALRDVNEVIPTFKSFHTNLRTHFYRSNTSNSQLIFNEENHANSECATRSNQDNCNSHFLHKSTPPQQVNTVCRGDESPMDDAFLMPLCSMEATSTPIPANRKMVSIQRNPQLSLQMNPAVPIQDFLQHFRFVDQWSNALPTQCSADDNTLRSEARVAFDAADRPNKELYVINALSNQVVAKGNVRCRRWKIDVLPGLEHECVNRQHTRLFSTTRLQPKVDPRQYSDENDLAYGNNVPKALFDETEYDSDADTDCSITLGDENPVILSSAAEPNVSLLSRFDDPSFFWTPNVYNPNDQHMESSSLIASDIIATVPLPPSIPDFVTPAQLRKIRDLRSMTVGHFETDSEAVTANLFVPTILRTSDTHSSVDVTDVRLINGDTSTTMFMSHQNYDCQTPVVKEATDFIPSDVKSIKETSGTDEPTSRTDSNCSNRLVENDVLDVSLSSMDLSLGSLLVEDLQSSFLESDVCTRNNVNASALSEIRCDEAATCRNFQIASNSDPVQMAWLKNAQELISMKTPKSCRSFEGDAAKEQLHNDCGCLSLSQASSACDVDNAHHIDPMQNDEVAPMTTTTTLPKTLSSSKLDESMSWDTVLERFRKDADPLNMIDRFKSANPEMNSLIHDTMKALSSNLSPRSMTTDQHQQQRYVNHLEMKENDEFMSNFLYCSKSQDERNDDITLTLINDDVITSSIADGGVHSSFLCLDSRIMSCGETENGYCCNNLFDGALTLKNIFLPPSLSVRNPTNGMNNIHIHQRVRSSINLGGAPTSRRESYRSECTNHHNSSTWLDLDDAFDTWVLGENRRRQVPEMNEADMCLLHISFHAPTLKTLQKTSAFVTDESLIE
jgi:hypothetical protein